MVDPDRTNAAGRSWPRLGTFLIALPVLYVLSIGPAAVIVAKRDLPNDALVVKFYAPVIWLHGHTPLRGPLENYLALWGAK